MFYAATNTCKKRIEIIGRKRQNKQRSYVKKYSWHEVHNVQDRIQTINFCSTIVLVMFLFSFFFVESYTSKHLLAEWKRAADNTDQ